MSTSLLNKKAVRGYILGRIEKTRPHLKFNRVSGQAIEDVEAKLKLMINRAVHSHPSTGKTFLYCQ